MIYTDRRAALEKLLADDKYQAIVVIYNDDRHLVAGLFEKRN
jgi:hypothetical protein